MSEQLAIFEWLPDREVTTDVDFQVHRVQFGDGVTQVRQKFLAPTKQKFSLSFTRQPDVIELIWAFLMRQRAKRFKWVYRGKTYIVRCGSLKRTQNGFVDSIVCEFVED